jgi:hypothetical protein
MKKKYSVLVLSVIFVLIAADLRAQDKGGDRVGGIRFGYHSSNFVKDGNTWSSDPMQSFYFGFFRDNKIIPLLHLGTGLEYFKNGAKLIGEDIRRDFHYVSVPLNAKLKLGPVFALTGFAPSFKVAERYVVGNNSTKPSDDLKAEWFDIPFFVGAGVKILFITVEARYHWGLLEVSNGYNSQYFQLGLGLSF